MYAYNSVYVYTCIRVCMCMYIYMNTRINNNTVLLKFRTWILNRGRRPKPEQRCETERAEIKRSGGMILIMHRVCTSLGYSKVVGERGRNASID